MAHITFVEKTITPELAKEYLARNHENNRSLNMAKVGAYARDMAAGKWRLTHQGIALDEHGKVIDGQHRLSAVIRANRSVYMIVATYHGESDMTVLDRGRQRTTHDALQIALGKGNAPHTLVIAFIRHFNHYVLGGADNLTENEILQFMNVYPELIKAVLYLDDGAKRLAATVASACVSAMINGVPSSDCRAFCKTIYKNEVYNNKDYNAKAALDFRDALTGKISKVNWSGRAQLLHNAKNALHQYVTGKSRLADKTVDRYPVTDKQARAYKFVEG